MIELKKEQLLFYFPYAPPQEHSIDKNESIYDVFRQIEGLLWVSLSTGNSNRPADIELKLIDYQSDVSKRKQDFEKMREALTEDEKKRQEAYHKELQSVIQKNVSTERLAKYPQGGIPWSEADDPKAFSKAYKKVDAKYQDLKNRVTEIEESFTKKMKGVSSVKLPNTDSFTRSEISQLSGTLIRAVRPLLTSDALEGEVGVVENGKSKQPTT